jgi:CRISPR-associated protein (Cas_Cas02710)
MCYWKRFCGDKMRRNFLVEAIANPGQQPIVFIFVITLGLGVAANGLSSLVLDVLGDWLEAHLGMPKVVWLISVVLFVVELVLLNIPTFVEGVRSLVGRNASLVESVNVLPLRETLPGLVVLMSLHDAAARAAILHHWQAGEGNLQHCWIICGGERSLAAAETMVTQLVEQGLPRRLFHYGRGVAIADVQNVRGVLGLIPDEALAQDPNYIRRLVEAIYGQAQREYGLDEFEMIADYTGGTKSMTAGMILACTKPTRRLQYWLSEYDENRQPVNSQMMEVEVDYRLGAIGERRD